MTERELTAREPILDLRVFQSRHFSLAILTQWAAVSGMFGTFFLVPLFLQQVRGYGALEAGIYTLPVAIASAICMQIGGRVFDRVGVRPPVLVGMTLIGVAMWLMSGLRGETTGSELVVPLGLLGAGMGMMMMALNTHLLNSAPRDLVGRVTSLTNALQNVVASLAIATYATILQSRIPVHVAESLTSSAPGGSGFADASALAFGDVYRTALVIVAVGLSLVWTLRDTPAPTSEFSPTAALRPAPATASAHTSSSG